MFVYMMFSRQNNIKNACELSMTGYGWKTFGSIFNRNVISKWYFALILVCFYTLIFSICEMMLTWNLTLNNDKQWKNSDEEKVHLEKIDFDAAGRYYCEVSTDTPIFTKESNVEQVHVIGKTWILPPVSCDFFRILFRSIPSKICLGYYCNSILNRNVFCSFFSSTNRPTENYI